MQHEFAEIERVHAIGVLGRVDRIDDGIGVNALRAGPGLPEAPATRPKSME